MTIERAVLTGFAVDLGGTKLAAARIESGAVVARAQVQTDGSATPESQVAAIAGILDAVGFVPGAALGVAVTGRLDKSGHWHAVNTGTLSQIGGYDLRGAILARFGPATCCNDAAAAALAESRFGAGRDAGNFAYLTISTGVGGGLVLGGHLLESANGLAGHVGFVGSRFSQNPCGSGRHATVESIAGGRAIAAAALVSSHEPTDARAVSMAARGGEPWAEAILKRSASAVAALIGDLCAILGLDAVAIGGSIGLSEGYIARLQTAMETEPPLFRVPIRAATLGQDAPLLGALTLHLERHPS